MSPSKSSAAAPATPQVSDYHDSSSDEYSEPERSAPVPPPPSATTSKSPTVLKTQTSTSQSNSSRKPQEPLVKPSKKRTPDSSKGAYAPIGTSSLDPPSDSSELSEFSSDLENQVPPPASQSRSPRGTGSGRLAVDEHEASEEEQEEEKQGRPQRSRAVWCWGLGGAVVIIIIVIGVVIYFLNSGKSSASDATSSHALNSTSELDHSSNSTSPASGRNSTSSSQNSTLSHNNSSMGLSHDNYTQTALPTNGIPSATGSEEIETTARPSRAIGSIASSPLEGSGMEVLPYSTEDPAQAAPTGDSSVNDENVQASTTLDSGSSLDAADAAHAGPTSLSSPSQTTNLDQNALPAQTSPIYGVESTQQGIMVDPIHTNEGAVNVASEADLPATINPTNVSPSPVPTFTLTAIESPSALPTEYLRPASPQVTAHDGSMEGGDGLDQQELQNQPQPTGVGSAWWPAPTLAADPNVPEQKKNKSTRWVGNATWFDPADANKACQIQYDDSDFVVALSTEIYGDSQSVSAFCGAKVNVWNPYTNETASATVLGVCEDCQDPTDINLSRSLFSEFDNPDIGILDVQWWFEDPLAIYFKETGWKGSCDIIVEDDSLSVALPLALWSDPSKSSHYCGKKITVKNTENGAVIEAQVVEASNRTDYTILTQIAFEHLGGMAEDGEMGVEIWFS
ncbi:hypothetical protein JCM3765_004067 [Sporobolomyces pararoseus]